MAAQQRPAVVVGGLISSADGVNQSGGQSNGELAGSMRASLVYSAKVTSSRPRTIGELRASGQQRETVKQEMRRNLLGRLRSGETLLAGIVGYDDTVLPQLANAIISGHDVILLGERGQAKSRIMRSLVTLLDPQVPAIAGCEINDNPYAPICGRCLDLIAQRPPNLRPVCI